MGNATYWIRRLIVDGFKAKKHYICPRCGENYGNGKECLCDKGEAPAAGDEGDGDGGEGK